MAEEVAALQYRLEASTARFERQIKRAESVMRRSAGQMERGARQSSQAFDATARAAGRMVAAIVSIEGVRRSLSAIASSGEQLRTLEARLDALTGSAERAAGLLSGAFLTSGNTGAGLQTVADLVTQFRIAADGVGATDAEVVRFSESLIKLGTIGGSSMTEIANGTRQLGRGLAGGVLRAEEFNSVVENTPLIAKALADELAGGSLGALRAMVLEGRVLSDQVFRAILNQSAQIDDNFAKLPVTMERATNGLSTAMTSFLGGLDQALGLSQGIAAALEYAAEALEASSNPQVQLGRVRNQIEATRAGVPGFPESELPRLIAREAELAALAANGPSTAPVVAPAAPPVSTGAGRRSGGKSPLQVYAEQEAAIINGLADQVIAAIEDQGRLGLAGEALAKYEAGLAAARAEEDLWKAARLANTEVSQEKLEELRAQADMLTAVTTATARQREAQEAANKAAEDGKRAIESVGNAITAGIQQADSFSDALKTVALSLLNLGIQGAFGAGPLAGAFRGAGLTIPGFANGTNSAPGGLAMVGERGRELVKLPGGSQVIPNGRKERMLGGNSIVINFSGDFRGSTLSAADVEARFRRFAAAELLPAINQAQRRAT